MRRDFKRVYNPLTGRRELQHWTGGVFIKSEKDILSPKLHEGGITGLGYKGNLNYPVKTKIGQGQLPLDIVENVDVGKTIIDNLKKRNLISGKGIESNDMKDIRNRVSKLISGQGLQVN